MTGSTAPARRIKNSLVDPHNIVYATIILLVAIDVVQYRVDEFGSISMGLFALLTIGPLVMVAVAHSFAGTIEIQVRQRRRLNRGDFIELATTVLQYVAVALVPNVIALVVLLARQDILIATNITEALGLVSLVLWGYYAAWATGHRPIRRIGNAFIYGFIGLIIILLELAVSH